MKSASKSLGRQNRGRRARRGGHRRKHGAGQIVDNKIGWHTLRHTTASHPVMRGESLSAVQALPRDDRDDDAVRTPGTGCHAHRGRQPRRSCPDVAASWQQHGNAG
jgi:hypothetical protein